MQQDFEQEISMLSSTEVYGAQDSLVAMTLAQENACGRVAVEQGRGQWYLALPLEVGVSPLYSAWRAVLDGVFGLLASAILLLLLPILALLIYLDLPGPIFYSQERLGLHGKPFRIYKFRSMRLDAERDGRAVYTVKHDPRITRIGHFLRATHLDELPQALNILRGEMSLIGPRPEREELAAALEKTIPFFRQRLVVKPGLTGWAQVKYRYVSTENDALIKLQYDLYYIKRRSFTLDLLILLKTIVEVLLLRGT